MSRRKTQPYPSLTIRLTDEMDGLLQQAVEATGRSQASIVNECISEALPQIVEKTARTSTAFAEKLKARSNAKSSQTSRS